MSGRLLAKRRYPRRRFRQNVGLLIDGKYTLLPAEELGEGGMSVLATERVPEGKQVLVTFALEGELHVMRGEVRYQFSRPEQKILFGIAFSNVNFKYKKLVRRYIGAKTEAELHQEMIKT